MTADFHTHILPGIDDGSASVEESLEMLRLSSEQEIRHIVATPHFYANHDHPARFLERREKALEKLMAAKPASLPDITLGAEVHYFEGISDCDALEALAIGNSGHIMIEMPSAPWSERMLRELLGINQKHGLTPIIAHIDRYISPFCPWELPEKLAQLPVLIQANASFFIRYGTRSLALRMLRRGDIHLLGSDCHNLTTRKPNLGRARAVIERGIGSEILEQLSCLEQQLLFR